MKFQVAITETLNKIIEVEASGEEEAYNLAYDGFEDGTYTLEEEDHLDFEVEVLEEPVI